MAVARSSREELRRINSPLPRPLLTTTGIQAFSDSVWVWALLPEICTEGIESDDLIAMTLDQSSALATVLPPGVEFQLKIVWTDHDPNQYLKSWDDIASVRAPGMDQLINLGAHRIALGAAAGEFRFRRILLGLKWPEPQSASQTARTGRTALSWLSSVTREQNLAGKRIAGIAPEVGRWFDTLSRSSLRGQPCPAGIIAWAYARELCTATTLLTDDDIGVPMLAGLCNGTMDPTTHPTYVKVTDHTTDTTEFVTVLVPAARIGFPNQELHLPGGEFLQILAELPGVDAMVRRVNHGTTGSLKLLAKAGKTIRSQISESQITEQPAPPDALEAQDAITVRTGEVVDRTEMLSTNHYRWIVRAGDPRLLADRVAQVIQRYTGLLTLVQVANIQDLLWKELFPGDQVRVPEFGHDQPLRTLAGSWFQGGSPLGDSTGCYLGANLGSSPGPVRLHLADRSEQSKGKPTTVVMTGMSGSGKSTAVMLFLLGFLGEGGWSFLPDFKGDLAGIVPAAQELLGVQVQHIDIKNVACSGQLDPMRFAPSADEARDLTIDALLGALSATQRQQGEMVIEATVDRILTGPRSTWSAPAVIEALRTATGNGTSAGISRELGEALRIRAKSAQLRAVLGPAPAGQEPIMTGRGLVYLNASGLGLPKHTLDPDQFTVPQRCAMVTMRTALAYALLQSEQVRALKKVIAIPELHLLTSYPEGQSFIDWLARVGRALQTYLLLDSQSAVDLSGMTGLLEQIVMALCFNATGHAEQNAQAILLRRPHPGPRLRSMLADLEVGQAVVRDRHDRIGRMEFDRLTLRLAELLDTNATEDTPTTSQSGNREDLDTTSEAGQLSLLKVPQPLPTNGSGSPSLNGHRTGRGPT